MIELQENERKLFNDFGNFIEFQPTWWLRKFLNLDYKIIGLFLGNQTGKTAAAMYSYVLRFLSIHPIPDRNVVYLRCLSRYCKNGHRYVLGSKDFPKDWKCSKCEKSIGKFTGHIFLMGSGLQGTPCPECQEMVDVHMRETRMFRFCSECVPGEKEDTAIVGGQSVEIKNTVYPALKKWLPPSLIVKDITQRTPALRIKDVWGGSDIVSEFVSYNMTTQRTAGFQRTSIYCDEQPPPDFLEEQRPRLLSENGDLIIGCTPAARMSYLYDDIFEKANVYIRTDAIVKKFGLKQIEETGNKSNIAVIQAATDDNPTLDPDTINDIFQDVDDPDVLAIRRYGIFRQVSGRIFKTFDYNFHYIDMQKYFPAGMFHGWVHGRFIDYHPHVPWAIINMSLNPYDELFVWSEYNPDPENKTIFEISEHVAFMGKDYKFSVNLIDPLAIATKKDGITVVDDLNRAFSLLKKEGNGTGAYWQPWDTKGTRGREEIRRRLKNSIIVGKPFNNEQLIRGVKKRLSTIWISNNCPTTAKSMRSWRLEEEANSKLARSRDMNETPQQRWSHFNMCIEAALKYPGFRAKRNNYEVPLRGQRQQHRFQGRA